MATSPTLTRASSPSRPGLRLSILLALGGVMVVAFVPLFFAVAQVTRATSLSYREDAARSIGRAVAAHVADAYASGVTEHALTRTMASHVGEGGAVGVAVYDRDGALAAYAGAPEQKDALRAPPRPYGESSTRVSGRGPRTLDIVVPASDGAVLVRVRADEDPARTAGIVRGIGLYMALFALGLLVFAYMALTRAIVRPIEQLARAADKVATGGRALEVPRSGAREIAELGASVHAMAARLLTEEQALRAKVDELTTTTRRLSETREQLEGSERMASVGRLAAGVAHEIGNPIAAIMGMHDLLTEGDLPDEDRVDFLRRMRKETERINVVVRDLLDYARPESAPTSGISAAADVSEVVSDVLALVRPQKEWRGLNVSVDVPAGTRVLLSPQRLTQVLLNLLLNAAGALAAEPDTASRTIAVRARTVGEEVRLEVEDNGPGVAPDLRDRIFDPFVTTKDVGAGTGLGLAVCRGIVEGARGRIFVDAAHTTGARFVVVLPRAA